LCQIVEDVLFLSANIAHASTTVLWLALFLCSFIDLFPEDNHTIAIGFNDQN
jgi:hypothetical protein